MKQETLEEANIELSKAVQQLSYDGLSIKEINAFKNGAKWQAERGYSEEEILNFADFYHGYRELIKVEKWEIIEMSKEDVFKKWFDKHKKK